VVKKLRIPGGDLVVDLCVDVHRCFSDYGINGKFSGGEGGDDESGEEFEIGVNPKIKSITRRSRRDHKFHEGYSESKSRTKVALLRIARDLFLRLLSTEWFWTVHSERRQGGGIERAKNPLATIALLESLIKHSHKPATTLHSPFPNYIY
jgi:hypothetical protein